MKDNFQAVIESLITQFLASPPSGLFWAVETAKAHKFLPLYFGWIATLGIQADGTMIRWDHEEGANAVQPLLVDFLRRMALKQGAITYPELETLVPRPTSNSRTCPSCHGTGNFGDGKSKIICECGGLGWLIPGEDRGESTG